MNLNRVRMKTWNFLTLVLRFPFPDDERLPILFSPGNLGSRVASGLAGEEDVLALRGRDVGAGVLGADVRRDLPKTQPQNQLDISSRN